MLLTIHKISKVISLQIAPVFHNVEIVAGSTLKLSLNKRRLEKSVNASICRCKDSNPSVFDFTENLNTTIISTPRNEEL